MSSAQFAVPRYIGAAPNGDILVADVGNFRVRRIHLNVVDTVAGTTISDNLPATSAFLSLPDGIVADGKGGILIGDTGDSRIRTVSSAGVSEAATSIALSGSSKGTSRVRSLRWLRSTATHQAIRANHVLGCSTVESFEL